MVSFSVTLYRETSLCDRAVLVAPWIKAGERSRERLQELWDALQVGHSVWARQLGV